VSIRTPALAEIRRAFFRQTQAIVRADIAAGRVTILAPSQDANADVTQMLLIFSFSPGLVSRAELGGHGALARRQGIWKVTISSHRNGNAEEPWTLADKLEEAFRAYTVNGMYVPPAQEGEEPPCPVYCDFPYTEDIGQTPDERNTLTVTVPWDTWTQN